MKLSPRMKKWIKFLSSLKLAVVVLLLISLIIAVGTVIESRYDEYVAKKWVYKTWWMYTVMSVLVINLTAVMVDRWPWKKHHTAFVLAHIGIIILLLGSLLTMQFGVDGVMQFRIGQKNRLVMTTDQEINVYATMDAQKYTSIYHQPVDFFVNPPSESNPYVIEIPINDKEKSPLKIKGYMPFATSHQKVTLDESKKSLEGLRFQLKNPNFTVVEWLLQKKEGDLATHNFGPAQVHLGPAPMKNKGGVNEVYLWTKDGDIFQYALFQKESNQAKMRGNLKLGQALVTPWMGTELKLLQYYPHAIEKWSYTPVDRPSDMTTQAIFVEYRGKDVWVSLNEYSKFFVDNMMILFGFGNQMVDIGEDLTLKKFEVGRYQGIMKAMSYQSLVEVPGRGDFLIAMNEPMKHNGYTFYQASFQEDPKTGQPIASILSVNKDPGRALKYFGSFVMSLGIVMLFFFRKNYAVFRNNVRGDE